MNRTAKTLLAAAGLASLTCSGVAVAQPAMGGGGGSATLYELPNFQGRSITVYRGADNLQANNFNDMARSAHFDGDWTVCSDANLRGNCQTLSGDVPNLDRYGLGRMVSSLRQGADYGASAGGGYGRNPGADRDDDRGDDRGGYGGAYGGDRGRGDDRGYGDNRGDGDDRGYGDNRGTTGPAPGPVIGGGYGDDRGGYGDTRWNGAGGVPGRSVVFFPRPRSNGQDIAAYDRSAADWFCRRQGLGSAVYYDTSYKGRAFRFNGGGLSINAPVLRDVVCRR
ncbi:MAG: beta/gamma crystallin family protein [Proteobacteria bacterium]|nr:beta/gamma crystallin family protein [Pseudomonadota bacterium]